MNSFENISVYQLKDYFDNNKKFVLLDVREPYEVRLAYIPSSIHIPMMDLPFQIKELNPKNEIIVYCKSGVRSAKICEFPP